MKKPEVISKPSTPETTVTAHQSNGLAVTSLVLGILSLTGFGLFLGIPAIIFGIIALRKSPTDKGVSWGGIITGAISTLISILIIGLVLLLLFISLVMGANVPHDVPYIDEFPSEKTSLFERV